MIPITFLPPQNRNLIFQNEVFKYKNKDIKTFDKRHVFQKKINFTINTCYNLSNQVKVQIL